jgi:ribosomal protein S18 acetylase RimI-like enzyme
VGEDDAVRVEVVTAVAEVLEAAGLFDHPVDERATEAFLTDGRHHLLIGYLGERPAGFVSAVELLHPDKPQPEAFLYELGVDPEHRRRGVATALMARLIELCRARGCGELFVLTDDDNEAARATYAAAGGRYEPAGLLFHWDWRR